MRATTTTRYLLPLYHTIYQLLSMQVLSASNLNSSVIPTVTEQSYTLSHAHLYLPVRDIVDNPYICPFFSFLFLSSISTQLKKKKKKKNHHHHHLIYPLHNTLFGAKADDSRDSRHQ
ncbi:hypothetical protein ASPTUDRAFT_444478 [Aspergillus tubingensis CBS 134.48]|uniref:Uncharacterized protein n=1 Tax=Aspergillus tubingensis (strain CBS 134.48) TaxID=767770 RepID=A0A1L9N9U3_ASPTC|nr:hypothetical protein ASPTUDRAFT_444478 [Aspergillus tubingensis CBS 134.48]